jgi:crotonobetaine/carnitine-CoA ligase
VDHGDLLLIVLPNGLGFLDAWFGTIFAGGISAAMNPRAMITELPAVLEAIRPATLIVEDEDRDEIGGLTSGWSGRILSSGELSGGTRTAAAKLEPGSWASLIQSSGSTGKPKFVIETHSMYTLAADGFPYWLGLGEQDRLYTSLPLSHINAQVYSTLGSFGCGASLELRSTFSASQFWDDVAESGATEFNAIGAMLEIMLRAAPVAAEKNHSVKRCYTGPAPSERVHREFEERFGVQIVVGYALSESPYGLVCQTGEDNPFGSSGRPRQHPVLGVINEAELRDDSGATVTDRVGELVLRNPAITPGYLHPDGTVESPVRDGWLYTGDLMWRDADGRYFFAGRKKEVIRRRGENVSPGEIEAVADRHEGVLSSAAVGVPSDLSEEDIKLFVKTADCGSADLRSIAEWVNERVPPYKRLRYIEAVEDWPLTETQKIAKRHLSRERNKCEIDLEAVQ